MKRSILIAEDEQSIRDSLLLILQEEGYDCTAVKNGRETMQAAKMKQYDLLITDIMMPEMNGIEVIKLLVKQRFHPPIMVLTAYSNADSASHAMKLGASDYLLKPIDFEELLDHIHNLLEVKQK